MNSIASLIERLNWFELSFLILIIAPPVGWFLAVFAHWIGD